MYQLLDEPRVLDSGSLVVFIQNGECNFAIAELLENGAMADDDNPYYITHEDFDNRKDAEADWAKYCTSHPSGDGRKNVSNLFKAQIEGLDGHVNTSFYSGVRRSILFPFEKKHYVNPDFDEAECGLDDNPPANERTDNATQVTCPDCIQRFQDYNFGASLPSIRV